MLKKLLIGVTVFAIVLMLALTYLTARYVDQEEILRAKTEMATLKAARDSIYSLVARKDSLQKQLQEEVTDLQADAAALREQVSTLEQQRKQGQLEVRQLKKKEDLQEKLSKTYPEMGSKPWGVTEVYDRENDVSIEYFMIPLWFTETFIIEHQNSENYRQQRNKLLLVDSLQTSVIVLKDSVFHLEQEKSHAYKSGYDDAYAKYDTLNQKYVELLQKPPQVNFGLPGWGAIVGSAAVGVLIGTQLEGRK